MRPRKSVVGRGREFCCTRTIWLLSETIHSHLKTEAGRKRPSGSDNHSAAFLNRGKATRCVWDSMSFR